MDSQKDSRMADTLKRDWRTMSSMAPMSNSPIWDFIATVVAFMACAMSIESLMDA